MSPGSKYLKWLYLFQVIPTLSLGPFGFLVGFGIFYLLGIYTQSSLKKALILALLPIVMFLYGIGYAILFTFGSNSEPANVFAIFAIAFFILMFLANIIGYIFLWRHYSALKRASPNTTPTISSPTSSK